MRYRKITLRQTYILYLFRGPYINWEPLIKQYLVLFKILQHGLLQRGYLNALPDHSPALPEARHP